jgi:transcriptional regulator with XRE-family HTH domain
MSEDVQRPETVEIIERARTFYLPREKDRTFAIRCGVSQTAYSGYTLGRGAIHIDNLLKIANETGASLQWLITGEGPRLKKDVVSITTTATDHSAAAVSQGGNAVATTTTSQHTQPAIVPGEGFSAATLAQLIQDKTTLKKCLEQLQAVAALVGE